MEENTNIFKNLDKKLVINLIILIIYGLLVLSSASLSLASSQRVMRSQIIASILGLVAMFVLVRIDYRVWEKYAKIIYFASVGVLLLTLLFGETANNATSWLRIPIIGFRFQPAEFTKIGITIALAAYLSKYGSRINEPKILLSVVVISIIPVGLIYIQPDAGTAIVYMFFIALMVFYSGINLKSILIILLIVLLLLPVFWFSMMDYQRDRILDFLDPSANSQGSSYQANQGLIAIGSGKISGKGLYEGNQTQFGYIPEKHNDFIFPVLVEELGFIGGALCILLYLYMLIRIFKIALKSSDDFGGYLCVGLGAMLVFHIIQNIGMTLGVLPITGIPLPFFSAGGTFQLINLINMGLILSVSAHNQ